MISSLLATLSESTAGGILRNLANCVVPEERVQIAILLGPAKGIVMSLELRHEKAYWLGIHEHKVQKFLMEVVGTGSVFYDLGANIGFYSLMAARLIGSSGRCFAFEPVPGNVERLEHNIRLNEMDQISVVPMAVSHAVGESLFKLGVNDSMGTLIYSEYTEIGKNSISVPVTTIDHFVFSDGNPPPDVVKMDIEGGEGKAVAGMREVFQRFRPCLICEVSGGESASQVWNALKSMDYKIYDVSGNLIENTPSYINIIAVP